MYTIYEVDYNDRCWKIGTAKSIKEACTMERKARKESRGEFPTFTTDGKKPVTNNGKRI